MIKSFEYIQPENRVKASDALADDKQYTMPVAGGTDLLGLMKHHIESPQRLVNLKALPDLKGIRYKKGNGLTIGTLTTVSEIAENKDIQTYFPVLSEAADEVASPQLRNLGTIGGNLCQRPRCWYFRGDFDCLRKGGDICYAVGGKNKYHCIIGGDPCFIVHPSDLAVALLALNARVKIFDGKKIKTVTLSEFFILPEDNAEKENILEPGEFIVEIEVPDTTERTRSGYVKFKERASWDFAIVSVAAVIGKNGNAISKGSIAFGGVAPKPWQEKSLNAELNNLSINGAAIRKAADKALKEAFAMDENEYKIALARNLLDRLLNRLSA